MVDGESMKSVTWMMDDNAIAKHLVDFVESRADAVIAHRHSLYRNTSWITRALNLVKKPLVSGRAPAP